MCFTALSHMPEMGELPHVDYLNKAVIKIIKSS